jgi:hypothetical protein
MPEIGSTRSLQKPSHTCREASWRLTAQPRILEANSYGVRQLPPLGNLSPLLAVSADHVCGVCGYAPQAWCVVPEIKISSSATK